MLACRRKQPSVEPIWAAEPAATLPVAFLADPIDDQICDLKIILVDHHHVVVSSME